MSRRVRVLSGLVLAVVLVAALPASAAAPERRLPPSDRDDLAAIFDPKVEALGFRTTRARLQDLETYQIDPKGRHLAVYLEPTADAFTDEQYVAAVTETTRVFLPMVFKRWKGLESFDVCLEPLPSEDDRAEPPAITQILVTRSAYKAVDWKTATLTDLIATANEYGKSQKTLRDFYLYFHEQLDEVPELVAAREAAAEQG
jgi:hypothetical protein